MTVAGICMVRDEADIIGATVAHMAGEVDLLIVADNNSTDGTREVLAQREDVILLDDPDPAYYQSRKMTALAQRARELGADWVVPFDADEWWYSPFGTIAGVLEKVAPQWLACPAKLYDHVATGVDPAGHDPLTTMGWRRVEAAPLPKVACRTRPDLIIEQGNHGACYDGGVTMLEGQLIVRHFPYRSAEQFCNPPDAPIWMADLGFRDLGDVGVGDFVMGAARVPGVKRTMSVPAEVVAVHRRHSPIVRVDFASGRWLRCTPDHLWRQHFYGSGTKVAGVRGREREDGRGWQEVRTFGGDGTYLPPKVGRSLSHVVAPTPPVHRSDERLAGWLGGMFDGEGSSDGYVIQIAQSVAANPEVYEDICRALKHFGFEFGQRSDRVVLHGGQQSYVDFFNVAQPRRRTTTVRSLPGDRLRNRFAGTFGARYATPDRIVSVEPDGSGDVIGLTTTTGNYVAWGYASKNCRKARNGAAAYAATDLPAEQGAHWRDYGRLLEASGEEALADVFRTWFWVSEPTADPTLIYDPAPR